MKEVNASHDLPGQTLHWFPKLDEARQASRGLL